ncbi:MAG: hypothetical protein H6721_14945 [Sandaracinus sp.]|nr:hypothetical protein [Sandaracinus sp.]
MTVAVRLPEKNTAAYTRDPSGLTASARGTSPKSVSTVSGVPAEAPRSSVSKTQTSARPTPGVA